MSVRFQTGSAAGTGTVSSSGNLTASPISVDSSEPVGSDPIVITQGELSVTVPFTVDQTPFGVAPITLPPAVPGEVYGPVTLHAIGVGASALGYTTTLKWKKISLPKGFKLSASGVLSGTLSSKLAPGGTSITVEVAETVTTVNGKKKIKTKTTSPAATIALTIG